MSEQKSAWREQITKIIADRAYTLNYDDGVQSRFMPIKSENGQNTIEVLLETTHMGHPFDLTWFVKFGDDPSALMTFEIVSPEGGTVWNEKTHNPDKLRWDAHVIPVFIRGYFAGRETALKAAAQKAAEEKAAAEKAAPAAKS